MVRWFQVACCFVVFFLTLAGPLGAQERTPDTEFDVRLELELDPRDTVPIEGEMVLATVRGYYRETITNEELKLRRMADFDWIQLKPDQWSEKRIGGLPTVILERRIALYAKRPGSLTLLPIAHELELMNRAQQRQIMLVRSEPVTLEIAAKPAGAGDDWLPVKAIEISDTWAGNPALLVDGENIERRVVFRALGVPPELLPQQPPMREPWLITFIPPEERSLQLTSEGPVSTVVWVWYMRPITGEPGVIPQIPIPYFDTTDRQVKSISIPSSPIGYASFANNDSSGWQAGFKPGAKIAVGFAAGLVIAVSAGLFGRRYSYGPIQRMGHWIERQRRFAELRRLEREGNIATFRGRMSELLTSETTLDEAERLELTSALDAEVFAGKPIDAGNTMSAARRAAKKLTWINK
ncbi:hypothetical protein [Roseibium algae]|uniref:Oxygen tolerance protein BatD n=1 Tax=Roseibium algae TaxID=3123038 RepID=A0ABU8TMJ2_9HYPH